MFAENKYIFLQTDNKIFTLGHSAAPRLIILFLMLFFIIIIFYRYQIIVARSEFYLMKL